MTYIVSGGVLNSTHSLTWPIGQQCPLDSVALNKASAEAKDHEHRASMSHGVLLYSTTYADPQLPNYTYW